MSGSEPAERFGEVESVKAVSDLYSPVGGEIVEVNTAAANDLARLAEDPYGFGWLVKIRIDDESSLANSAELRRIPETDRRGDARGVSRCPTYLIHGKTNRRCSRRSARPPWRSCSP